MSFWPSSGILIRGMLLCSGVFVFLAIMPAIAMIGLWVPSRVCSSPFWFLAVIIFGMSFLFAMRLWKPSMKMMSSCSCSSRAVMWSRSFSAISVFLMMSISSGEMATIIFEPALAYRHVLVPSLSMVKPLWCMCFIEPIL